MPGSKAETLSLIVEIVDDVRGMAAPREESWKVCIFAANHELIGTFSMSSYSHVAELGKRLRPLGYVMTMLHPADHACDFAFHPEVEAGASEDILSDGTQGDP